MQNEANKYHYIYFNDTIKEFSSSKRAQATYTAAKCSQVLFNIS